MLLTIVSLTLITIIKLCNAVGHNYLSPEDYDTFHQHLTDVKKREIADTILSEIGEHASLTKRFDEQTYRRVVRISQEKLDEREQNRRRRFVHRRQRRIRVKHSIDENLHKKTLSLAKTTTITIVSKTPEQYPTDPNRLWFNVSSLSQYNFEEAAILYYVGRVKSQYPERQFKARFYYYTSPSEVAEYTVLSTARELDNVTGLMTKDANWESFDITALARNWIENPDANYGIMIKLAIEDDDGNEEYGEIVAASKPSAYLEISNTRFRVKHKRNSVIRSKTPTCESTQNHRNTSCCLFPFSLSFDDFNWDWIIAPKRIDFYYCAGYCNIASLKTITHSQVLYTEKNMQMCCAPEISEAIDILYQDTDGNLQLKSIPNMIVRSCTCS
jgi:cell division protein FtsB